ncbi:MAG: hypothetical protein QOG62_383 [Thermoleophilaceae bacterium]|nr:hypothetical protein [Thermoleophilaceae bacterium]
MSTTYPGIEVQEPAAPEAAPFRSPDERIAALEARIAADRERSVTAEAEVEARIEDRQRTRVRRRRAWQFAAGVAVGVACTLLISASISDDAVPTALGADSLARSLGAFYIGAPFDCKTAGGGFECFQPTAAGGTTLQVRLDYRGCWESKPNTEKDIAAPANGCIGQAPHSSGSVNP